VISIAKYLLNSIILFAFLFSGVLGTDTVNQLPSLHPLPEANEVKLGNNPFSACNTYISEEELDESTNDSTLLINKVMFNPVEGDYEWVEIKNNGPDPIDISGYFLTDEDDNWYEIPDALPPMPADSFVIVIFDGAGLGEDDYDFSDNVAILHSQAGLIDIFEDDFDQVALYKKDQFQYTYLPLIMGGYGNLYSPTTSPKSLTNSISNKTIIGFMAWGAPPTLDAANAENAGLWNSSWFVSLSIGLGIENPIDTENISLGLLPNSIQGFLDDWVVFQTSEVTFGFDNVAPVISWFYPADGALVDGATFAISWNSIDKALNYHFQLDDTVEFLSPLVDVNLVEPSYISASPLVDGVYFWRVQVTVSEVTSEWSAYHDVETIDLNILSAFNQEIVDGINSSVLLPVTWQLQHKDTNMLCLDGDNEFGSYAWDSEHASRGTHGKMYCARATMAMMASYYGSNLSQDRISYKIFGNGKPEGDLGHNIGVSAEDIDQIVNWSLGMSIPRHTGKPSFENIKSWIDNDQPIYSVIPGHARLINGYREINLGWTTLKFIHLLDPWDREKWVSYSNDNIIMYWLGPSGQNGAPSVLMEEDEDSDGIPDTMDDSDGDGIVDFDERYRFGTSVSNPDSDYDSVTEKLDIREYLFDNDGNYRHLNPDIDRDGLRKELDWDNDNGGSPDGCEDYNHNGKWEPGLGETDNLNGNYERRCAIPTLQSPPNNSTLNTLIPLLQWENGSTSDISNVYLDYSTRENFMGSGGSWYGPSWYEEFQIGHNLNPSTKYFWRVYFMKDGYQEPYSEVWSFTTGSGGTFLPAPNLVSPSNGSTLSSNIVTFNWSPVSGALGYIVNWQEVGQYVHTYVWVSGSETSLERSIPENTTFEWWVEAYNCYAIGNKSITWEFTTGAYTSSSLDINSNQNYIIEEVVDDWLYQSIYYDTSK